MNKRVFTLAAITIAGLFTAQALAIKPATWTHTTEADFEPGVKDGVMITNLGDIKLASDTKVLASITESLEEEASIVYDVQKVGDVMYLAAGPEAKLVRVAGEDVTVVASLEGQQIFSLDMLDGKLLAGVSGVADDQGQGGSRLAVLNGETLEDLIALPDARYVWDMIVNGGTVFVATGNEGKLLKVTPSAADKASRVVAILETTQSNILCIGKDKKGHIYAGTDGEGLVYRLAQNDDGSYTPFILYDAAEPEIGAMLVRADGTVFFGTADANQARPGRLEAPAREEAGRPDSSKTPIEKAEPGEPDIPNVPPKPEPKDNAEEMKEEATGQDVTEEPAQPDEGAASLEKPAEEAAPAEEAPAEGEAAPDAAGAAKPTTEQRDQLRQVIRQRLLDARKSGQLQVGPATGGGPVPSGPRPSAGPTPRRRNNQQAKPGNGLYRIDPEGFVTEIFRESVMILRLAESNGRIYAATGNEGQVFRVDPEAQEKAQLVDLDAQQVTAIHLIPGDKPEAPSLLLATSNPADLIRIDPTVAAEGTFESDILDASQVSLWGAFKLTASIPAATSVRVQTRSGNLQDPEEGPWSDWTDVAELMHDAAMNALQPRSVAIKSPPARFLQYRLTLSGDGKQTPSVDQVELTYVLPNLPPDIKSIKAAYAPAQRGQQSTKVNVEWQAADANGDTVIYTLEYQPAGSKRWLPLAKDVAQNRHEWETATVPDGWYAVHVIASDAQDNTPDMAKTSTRKSDPLLVDNTPPAIKADLPRPEREGEIALELAISDRFSDIAEVHYAIDGDEDWKAVLPGDLIFDSTSETLSTTIRNLSTGPHVLTVRAKDARGNTAHEAVLVEVE